MGSKLSVARMVGLCMLAGVLLAGMLFPVVGGLGMASNQVSATISGISGELVEGEVPLVTTVTDRDGVPIAFFYDQHRFQTTPEDVNDTMRAAIVAIEDRRFFEHDGVDWQGTTRAMLTNFTSTGSALEGQGASTLTMQYVKNYLLYAVAQTDQERAAAIETTPARKLREIRIATHIEQRLSKEEILNRYLDIVFFGNNAYGIAAAARTYFDTTPDQLTIPQAALLAGMVRSTSRLDPVDQPEAALQRRNLVIDAMVDVGSITPQQGEQAKAEPLGIVSPLVTLPNMCPAAGTAHGFFCQYVLNYLGDHGFSEEQLRRGGYLIRTSLDRRASDIAKAAANGQVPPQTPGIANAMAIVEPGRERHQVTALVANRNYGQPAEQGGTFWPLPTQVQPFGAGSIFKTFVAGAALEQGFGIHSIMATPTTYSTTAFGPGGQDNCPANSYCVTNAGEYPPAMTMQQALATSPNTAWVMMEERVGVGPSVNMAYRLGLRRTLNETNMAGRPPNPNAESDELRMPQGQFLTEHNIGSFTLGPTPVSTLELANVAATIMSSGTWCPPTPVMEMRDRHGRIVPLNEQPCEQVVPEGLANTLAVGMSQDIYPPGTAAQAAGAAGWTRPMLGKTGTTQANRSAGFIGATPQYAGAVLTWPDGDSPAPICDGAVPYLCSNGNIFGGRVPARTWFDAMNPLHAGLPVVPMPPVDPRYLR